MQLELRSPPGKAIFGFDRWNIDFEKRRKKWRKPEAAQQLNETDPQVNGLLTMEFAHDNSEKVRVWFCVWFWGGNGIVSMGFTWKW